MGHLCGKASSKDARAPAETVNANALDKTLAKPEPNATEKVGEKPVQAEQNPGKVYDDGSFNCFVDSLGFDEYLKATDDGSMLRVVAVEGGAIGLWNNRGRTEKVKVGDLVVKVRRVDAKADEWVTGAATAMLELLGTKGPYEMLLRRGEPVKEEQPVVVPVPEDKTPSAPVPDADSTPQVTQQPAVPGIAGLLPEPATLQNTETINGVTTEEADGTACKQACSCGWI